MSTPELSETPAKFSKTDIKEVTKSIDFLEMLEKQTNFKNGIADTGSELSQEEIYQLIREGISYYDNLSCYLYPNSILIFVAIRS